MGKSHNDNQADVFIVHTDSEWQVARKLAYLLDECGYIVAHSGAQPVNYLPSDARVVIVIWPVTDAIFEMPAFEARVAARDGRLVQVYAGAARPGETYDGPSAVDFAGWDLTATGSKWRALMQRLRPLCGPPPRRPVDSNAATQSLVLYSTLVLAVGSIAAVLVQGMNHHDVEQAVAPMAPAETMTQAAVRSDIVLPPAQLEEAVEDAAPEGLGGPERYDRDLGVEESPRAPVAAPPPPAKRAPQNPPSALE
jgi:hypothetical protein